MTHTLTVLVPAYNEEDGLPDTLDSLLAQLVPAEEIIVVDDYSTDRTREVALSYGVTVITPPANLGSKAKAQNYGLAYVTTDLVLPVDADTTLDPDYIAKVKARFDDPDVAVAAGCVLTKYSNTIWEKARQIEYLFGFHWYRPVQQAKSSVTVCSGCCTIFRVSMLRDFGGFPERTIVEDIDYTWSQQLLGRKAEYVHDAIARAAEPVSAVYLSKQLKRWKSGYFQNVRMHYGNLLRHKRWLALWVSLQLAETILAPLVLLLPLVAVLKLHVPVSHVAGWWLAGEAVTLWPPVLYGCWKRKVSVWRTLASYPAWYVLKAFNFYHDWRAMMVELIGVPLGLTDGLMVYEKGRADTVQTLELAA